MSKQGSPFDYKKITLPDEDGQSCNFNSRDPIFFEKIYSQK